MTSVEFLTYLKSPKRLNNVSLTELESLLEDYPYCSGIRMLVKNNFVLNSGEKDDLIKSSSVHLYDRKKLFRLLHDISDENHIQPPIISYSLEVLQDKNNQYGQQSDIQNDLIDKFLKEQPRLIIKSVENNINFEESPEEIDNEQEFVSEILAEIYWKQGNRNKAIHIYEKLSLNFPEKNSYFAAQIEKIKKEII